MEVRFLEKLILIIQNALRTKVVLIHFLYFLEDVFSSFERFKINDPDGCFKYISYIIDKFLAEFEKLVKFEEELDSLFEEHPEIYKVINTSKTDVSIIKTKIGYSLQIVEGLRLSESDFQFLEFRQMITDDKDLFKEEIKNLSEFYTYLSKLRLDLIECCECDFEKGGNNIAITTCKSCNRPICEKHVFAQGYCAECAKKVLEERIT
ncbi:MAG TPA: hypothetical protein VKM55_01000 [Candidatus Lokiarchaeia archaeon]|nr:hypothetical protein [Candidatus Lokiarchaeia archaeon]